MQESNFGIVIPRSSAEGFFFRAWLRGHKMNDPESDDPISIQKWVFLTSGGHKF